MLGHLGTWARRTKLGEGRVDAGFTVVEMIVALSLMAIVMAGLAPAIDSALQTAAIGNRRTAANGLATAAIEQMRSVSYPTVGYVSEPAACGPTVAASSPFASYASEPPVLLAGGVVTGLPPFGYTVQDTPNNVVYTVQSCVYWMNASGQPAVSASPPANQNYKQSVVSVSWTDSAGPHDIVDVSAIYPANGNPSVVGPKVATLDPALIPPVVTLVTPDPAPGVIDVDWNPSPPPPGDPVAGYEVEYGAAPTWSDPNSFVTSPVVNGLSYQATGLTPGVTYYFEVVAVSAIGVSALPTPTPLLSSTAPGGTSGSCAVSSISLSPSTGTVYTGPTVAGATTNALTSPYKGINVTVNASANCGGAGVSVAVAGPNGLQWPSTVTPLSDTTTAGVYTGTFGTCSGPQSGMGWIAPGNYTFTVYVGGSPWTPTGTGNNGVVQGAASLTPTTKGTTAC